MTEIDNVNLIGNAAAIQAAADLADADAKLASGDHEDAMEE